MASFRIDFKPSVEKDLRRLPAEIITRSMEKIDHLESDPFPLNLSRYLDQKNSIVFEWAIIG